MEQTCDDTFSMETHSYLTAECTFVATSFASCRKPPNQTEDRQVVGRRKKNHKTFCFLRVFYCIGVVSVMLQESQFNIFDV